jgi:predicted ester cyclase
VSIAELKARCQAVQKWAGGITNPEKSMTKEELSAKYREYLDCLNRRDWASLDRYVDAGVIHNAKVLGVSGYRAMLERDVRQIPDLRFNIEFLMADPPFIACRLRFDCAPAHEFLGLHVDGRRVVFSEHVFYEFREGKIIEVWSVLDKSAIEAQLN